MTVLEQVEKALEPFAVAWELWKDTGEYTKTQLYPYHLQRGSEALAALRQWREQAEQGFEAWWGQLGEAAYDVAGNWRSHKETSRAAYLAGQLSGIPKELRETLIEALRLCAEDVTPYWREFADARKQLEAL